MNKEVKAKVMLGSMSCVMRYDFNSVEQSSTLLHETLSVNNASNMDAVFFTPTFIKAVSGWDGGDWLLCG